MGAAEQGQAHKLRVLFVAWQLLAAAHAPAGLQEDVHEG